LFAATQDLTLACLLQDLTLACLLFAATQDLTLACFRLEKSKEGDKPETVQDYIFKAANMLVREDKMLVSKEDTKFIYQIVCSLLVEEWRLDIGGCRKSLTYPDAIK
jgi:hypothetical protein